MSISDKIAELLQSDIQTAIEQSLCLEAGSGKGIAGDVFNKLQTNWGGKEIYMPVRKNAERNKEIRAAFNGRNHAEVCKRFDVSLSHLYRIIK